MDTNNDHRGFRVWDTKEKCYVDKEHDHSYSSLCEDGSVKVYRHALGETYFDDDSYDGRYIPEQCTGLKDQDGKLIYAEDLLHIVDPIPGVEFMRVIWSNGCWYAQGKHCKQRLFELLQDHKIIVVGTVHDKEV